MDKHALGQPLAPEGSQNADSLAQSVRQDCVWAKILRLASSSRGERKGIPVECFLRHHAPMAPKNILVPVDFSDPSEAALDYAVALAKPLGAKVTVVHSYEIPVVGLPEGAMVLTADVAERILTASQAALDATLERRKDAGVVLVGLLKNGDPRDVVPATAKEVGADLIVMGTHGRRGIARALLGSVAESVLRTAPAPVLAVRAPAAK